MKGSTKLFRLFGIDIKLHFSWWFVFALLAWSLSSAFFPHYYPDFPQTTYWFMGIAAAVLLFVSVLLHELSHSLVAKAKKIKVSSITLFFFGGVAGIEDEDMKPTTELLMSLAGPFFSLFLAGVCFLIYQLNDNLVLSGIMFYLYQLNLILAIFNLVPGYPLDGGRAFRAILHAYYHNLRKATQIAARGGKFFAAFLVFLGVFGLITGVINGLWFIFLGGFLWFIAGMSYEQVVIKETLSKVPFSAVIEKKYLTLDSKLTFAQAIRKTLNYDQNTFVVKKGKQYLGILDLRNIVKMSPEAQERVKVSEIILPKAQVKSLTPNANTYKAFRTMLTEKTNLLPVLKGKSLVGIVSRKTLTHRLVLELKYGHSEKKAQRIVKRHTTRRSTKRKVKSK